MRRGASGLTESFTELDQSGRNRRHAGGARSQDAATNRRCGVLKARYADLYGFVQPEWCTARSITLRSCLPRAMNMGTKLPHGLGLPYVEGQE
jgi:hypothetical protein